MKYVIYLRVSTKKQDKRTQLDACLQYMRTRAPLGTQYEVYEDEITSKKKFEKRPGIQAALNALNEGDILLGIRVDRIARGYHEISRIIERLEIHKAEVEMVEQPGIKNKILLGLYSGMAEEEVKLLRKRIHEKFHSKRKRGERISHKIPYGYKLDMENLIPIKNRDADGWTYKPGRLLLEDREQLVLAVMDRLLDEGRSYREIAQELTRLGYMNRVGKPFHHMSLYRIVQRRARAKSTDQLLAEREDRLCVAQ